MQFLCRLLAGFYLKSGNTSTKNVINGIVAKEALKYDGNAAICFVRPIERNSSAPNGKCQ